MAEDTRQRIVTGAYRALVHQGYAATSVKDIAEEAGVAPGLIHYYFASKEELLVAVIRHCCKQVRPASGGGAARGWRAALEAAKTRLALHQDFNRLFFGMLGVGLHDPRIAQALGEFIREQQADVERLVRAAIAERGAESPLLQRLLRRSGARSSASHSRTFWTPTSRRGPPSTPWPRWSSGQKTPRRRMGRGTGRAD